MGQMLGTSENYIFFSLENIINIKVRLTGRFVNNVQSNNLKFIKTGLQLLSPSNRVPFRPSSLVFPLSRLYRPSSLLSSLVAAIIPLVAIVFRRRHRRRNRRHRRRPAFPHSSLSLATGSQTHSTAQLVHTRTRRSLSWPLVSDRGLSSTLTAVLGQPRGLSSTLAINPINPRGELAMLAPPQDEN